MDEVSLAAESQLLTGTDGRAGRSLAWSGNQPCGQIDLGLPAFAKWWDSEESIRSLMMRRCDRGPCECTAARGERHAWAVGIVLVLTSRRSHGAPRAPYARSESQRAYPLRRRALSMADSNNNRSPALWWGISAIFVAGLIIALVIVLVMTRDTGEGTQPSPSTPTDRSATPGTPAPDGDGCSGLPAEDQTVPQSAPEGVEWEATDYQVLVPTSEAAGPAAVDEPLAKCYARTPTGALLAATQIYMRMIFNPDASEKVEVLEEQMLPGPGKAELSEALQNAPAQPPFQVAGFSILNYSQGESVIKLATVTASETDVFTVVLRVQWDDGDWALNGDALPEPGQISRDDMKSDFIPWGQG